MVRKTERKSYVKRISISLPPKLLSEFNAAMQVAGLSDRSKAIQTALHSFIDQYEWQTREMEKGAGTINMLYNNHTFDQDAMSTQIQHEYNSIISASTHIHLDSDNCLETIMLKGEIRKMKELANSLSKNRGIKSIKINFVSIV